MTKVSYNTVRPFKDVGYKVDYVTEPSYSISPKQYIRGFEILQKDLLNLFDFIEPADNNLDCYSFRIHELFVRSCIELEANFKAILENNDYTTENNLNIKDYNKLEKTHKLSYYKIKIPNFQGSTGAVRVPFANWSKNQTLSWYQDYNNVKHNRASNFEKANLRNLLDAFCGLLVVLSSQFHTENFSNSYETGSYSFNVQFRPRSSTFISTIGDYFLVDFPPLDAWDEDEKHTYMPESQYVFEKLKFK